MSLTLAELRALAVKAGFSDSTTAPGGETVAPTMTEADFAAAIAMAESHGNPTATNKNSNGTTDYGLWQINSVHKDVLSSGKWQDPQTNANMAYKVYQQAGGWNDNGMKSGFMAWTTYKNNKFQQYMNQTTADKGQVISDNPTDKLGEAVVAGGNAIGGWVGDLGSMLKGWAIPVGVFILGAGFVLIAAVMLFKNMTPIGAATHIATQSIEHAKTIKSHA